MSNFNKNRSMLTIWKICENLSFVGRGEFVEGRMQIRMKKTTTLSNFKALKGVISGSLIFFLEESLKVFHVARTYKTIFVTI